MKIFLKIFFITLATFTILNVKLNAQVSVILQQPPHNKLGVADLWKLTLNNASKNTYKVYLEGTVDEAKDGRILLGKSQLFDLLPGIKIITANDVNSSNITYSNNKYKEIIIRTGNPPSGDYTICVNVILENGNQLGSDCKNQVISNISPPVLISPTDGDSVNQKSLVFNWMPPSPIQDLKDVSYTMRIVEILGNQSLSEAIEKNQSIFEQSGIQRTTFQYPPNGFEFQDNHRYGWNVSVNVGGNVSMHSDPFWFTPFSGVHIPIRYPLFTVNPTISAGFVYGSSMMPDQTIKSWGQNANGELGIGGSGNEALPTLVIGLIDMTTVSAGEHHTLALKDDGTVWAWGTNNEGELGNPVFGVYRIPMEVTGISNVIAISAGMYHSLALKRDGTVWSWGSNLELALGRCSYGENFLIPGQVEGLSDIVNISAGTGHSIALKRDGTVWSWGSNRSGNLGNGSTDNSCTPVQVTGLSEIIAISEGKDNFSYALKRDGTVWSWGDNVNGKLGDGTRVNRNTPVRVSGITDAAGISAGFEYALVLKRDGTIWGCGDNNFNQLGRGHDPTLSSTTMEQVPYLGDGYVEISAGGQFSLALKSDGTLWAWGSNVEGEFGNGVFTDSRTPVQVLFTH